MLQELSIRNFAIIDDLQIRFTGGLTILSGETGAGKSIILNAVNLLLGTRASAELVRTGAEAAELEALFQIDAASPVAAIMNARGYDASQGLVVRRIISRSDSNRVYINGRLATIGLLTTITENLASISGQHAHQGLLKEDQHLLILDQFGGLLPLRQELSDGVREILPLIDKLRRLKRASRRQSERIDLLEFQKREIRAARISRDEDTHLEQERARLKNAEGLCQAVHGGIEALYSAPGSVVEQLLEVKKSLERAGRIDPQLAAKAQNLAETVYGVEDLVEGLRTYLGLIQVDEGRLETVEERLDALVKLKRKYGGSLAAVLAKLEAIEEELAGLENLDAEICELEKQLDRRHGRLAGLALELSARRAEAAEVLAQKMVAELGTLKMSKTQFQVVLQALGADEKTDPHLIVDGRLISETGLDRAVFLIAPNVGEKLKPLASIASGGELSRVVLALKAILAKTDAVETVVFDEVDAGIGGGVAEVVGRKLSALARYHQIICITHLPQIAKFGDHHYRVTKHVAGGRTRTLINALDAEERYREIARMLGGEKITRATLAHARELLKK